MRSAEAPPGGVKDGSTCTRSWEKTGKGSSPRGENPRKQGSLASWKAKRDEGESLTDGSVVERESMPQLNGRITPMEDAFAVSRDAGNPPVRFDVAGAGDGVMEPLNGHEAGNGRHSQGASCTPPRRSPTRLHSRVEQVPAGLLSLRSRELPSHLADAGHGQRGSRHAGQRIAR
jgi:hypothetical protein